MAQLEQFLALQRSAHASDSDSAQKLRSAELTERLTPETIARIKNEYSPAEQTAAALELLADVSAFLDPPTNELPRKDPPPPAAQQEMLRAAENFATDTLKHLPDFLATRTTRSFEDIPVSTRDRTIQSGLHPIGTNMQEVAYRNRLEVSRAAPDEKKARLARKSGLLSAGEFGPLLGTILTDSAPDKIVWSHWESSSAGILAVFSYAVPREASHYMVEFCCISNSFDEQEISYRGTPAYHGTLAINPATGTILRVTLEAEFPDFDPEPRVDVMVEYHNVEIGQKGLICPERSIAVSEAYTLARKRYWRNLFINEMTYTNYRRFGSTVRVMESPAR